MSNDELKALVQKHADELGEHFDCVQIFVNWDAGDGKIRWWDTGCGNWFSRFGQVSLWADAQMAKDAAMAVDQQRENGENEPE